MSSLSATMCSLNPVPPPTYLNLSPTPVSYSFPCFVLGFDLSHKSCLGVCVCVFMVAVVTGQGKFHICCPFTNPHSWMGKRVCNNVGLGTFFYFLGLQLLGRNMLIKNLHGVFKFRDFKFLMSLSLFTSAMTGFYFSLVFLCCFPSSCFSLLIHYIY